MIFVFHLFLFVPVGLSLVYDWAAPLPIFTYLFIGGALLWFSTGARPKTRA